MTGRGGGCHFPLFTASLSAYLVAMIRVILLALLVWSAPACADRVVLLHGLARSEVSFLVMQEVLGAGGHDVFCPGYPSTSAEIDRLARDALTGGLRE
jgi:hypothetical protein